MCGRLVGLDGVLSTEGICLCSAERLPNFLAVIAYGLLFQFSQIETAAGGETSLFGLLMTSDLAVFPDYDSARIVIILFWSK